MNESIYTQSIMSLAFKYLKKVLFAEFFELVPFFPSKDTVIKNSLVNKQKHQGTYKVPIKMEHGTESVWSL